MPTNSTALSMARNFALPLRPVVGSVFRIGSFMGCSCEHRDTWRGFRCDPKLGRGRTLPPAILLTRDIQRTFSALKGKANLDANASRKGQKVAGSPTIFD